MNRFRNGCIAACVAVLSQLAAAGAFASQTMVAPAALIGQTIVGASGTVYTTDAAGYFTVSLQSDVLGLLADGFTLPPAGLSPTPLHLIDGKNAAGTTLAAAASAGEFGISLAPGTSEVLTGEAATGATKTDAVVFEYVLPANYHAGQNLTLTLHAAYSGSGTAGTVTVAGAAYAVAAAGTMGASLIATSAQAITTSDAAYAFTLSGATLAPGSRLILKATLVIQETGGSSPLTGTIDSATIG